MYLPELLRRRRAVEKSDDEDDDPDDMEDDLLDEEEGDNEVEAQAASVSGLREGSGMLEGLASKGDDAMREIQRQRNLEQALFIQMEMQKKLHEQLEVIITQSLHPYASLPSLCMPDTSCLSGIVQAFAPSLSML